MLKSFPASTLEVPSKPPKKCSNKVLYLVCILKSMVYSTFTITYCSTFQTFKYLFNGTLSLNFPIKSGNSGYKHFNFAAFPFSYSTRQKKRPWREPWRHAKPSIDLWVILYREYISQTHSPTTLWNALKTFSVACLTNETEKVTMCERQLKGSAAEAPFPVSSPDSMCTWHRYSLYMDTLRGRCVCHPL